jgi:hypothetical protein
MTRCSWGDKIQHSAVDIIRAPSQCFSVETAKAVHREAEAATDFSGCDGGGAAETAGWRPIQIAETALSTPEAAT